MYRMCCTIIEKKNFVCARSSGLFPLLGHAAMSVKMGLLALYERYFLPLQKALLPSLQAFVMGLLPGLEEGLEVYDRYMSKVESSATVAVNLGSIWENVIACFSFHPL